MKMMNKAALAAVVVGGLLSAGAAEAANISFSYKFSADPSASIEGIISGDIVGTKVENINLASSAAEFRKGSTQILLNFIQANPFSLDTANPLDLKLIWTDAGGNSSFFVDTSAVKTPFAGAFSVNPSLALLDTTFGTWNTLTQPGSQPPTPVPTPALLPGLMLMGGALRRRLRRNSEEAA
ncbi:MAG: PTPA-CTERM sorting domain-containing protein [Synechococcales cyanobacterium RU_4_20]|nr:PTPA-CTERM sorting domain-containing protein [Synechococcales cyanobacterium RU_4_20]